jgi:hypothetical protein
MIALLMSGTIYEHTCHPFFADVVLVVLLPSAISPKTVHVNVFAFSCRCSKCFDEPKIAHVNVYVFLADETTPDFR